MNRQYKLRVQGLSFRPPFDFAPFGEAQGKQGQDLGLRITASPIAVPFSLFSVRTFSALPRAHRALKIHRAGVAS